MRKINENRPQKPKVDESIQLDDEDEKIFAEIRKEEEPKKKENKQ